MRPRVRFARFLLGLGNFVRSLAVVAMRPEDLMAFGREAYAAPSSVEGWSAERVIGQGLSAEEEDLRKRLPGDRERLLLLGVGGGREAIPLARAGYEVTGVDFVEAMTERAKRSAQVAGVRLKTLVQNIAELDVPAASFGVVWLSAAMYSCVPTRPRRVAMLRKIHRALAKGGHFVCQFHWDPQPRRALGERLRKIAAWVMLGNVGYEGGDMLWGGIEFLHAFGSASTLQEEFASGGFDVVHLTIPETGIRGGAVLRKRDEQAPGEQAEGAG